VTDSRFAEAFIADAFQWCRAGSERALDRLIRSPYSGVPHDCAAAYATLAAHAGPLLDAIERERLALPALDRDAVLRFAARARALRSALEDEPDAALRTRIEATFDMRGAGETAPLAGPETARSDAAIELAAPASAEATAGVRARQSHFSASALNAFAECERKWYYRYVCSAIEDPGSSAATYGTAFHLALEDFHEEFPRPRAGDEAAMRERVREYVTWAFERHREGFPTRVELELQRRRAQRTAQRYVDWLVAESARAPFDVIGREVPANLDLDGHAFVGFIDRLDRDERTGGVGIVDYKTGAIAVSAAEYRDKVRKFRDFQLPFYYWARTALGDRVTRLALVPLKDALIDVRPIVLEVGLGPAKAPRRDDAPVGTIAVEDLERARARMIAICDRLTSGDIQRFAVTTDPAACTYCAYVQACAHRPPVAQERFGR
jgi:PD-(D/E)XK nuclease superfamily